MRPKGFTKEKKRRGQGKFVGLDLLNGRQGSLVTEMAGRRGTDCDGRRGAEEGDVR